MRRILSAAALLLALAGPPAPAPAQQADPAYALVNAFPGVTFTRALDAKQPPDGTPRMFVAEQDGRIWIVEHPAPAGGAANPKRLFLDVTAKVNRGGNEEGLLGFAFHPGFATNGRVILHYTARYSSAAQRRNVLSEVVVSAADPDAADAASERVILEVSQPYTNHNGGWVGFAQDGMLHVALGDGGSGGDPQGYGQRLDTLLGKILRIDVDRKDPGLEYAVPQDNPFVARGGARGEIWAYGLRNPWRCSFDRATGDLFAGDVGQDRWEEVDRIVRGGNYGWNRKEGDADYLASQTPPADALVAPLAVYSHSLGESVTGGVVYRGAAMPSLEGRYLYGDFVSGRLWALDDPYVTPAARLLLDTDEGIASFAEDRAGEVYVVSFRGQVLRLRSDEAPPPPPPPALPGTLSELGIFEDLAAGRPVASALRYDVRSPLWSDGAAKDRFLVLPEGTSLGWDDADAFDLPVGGLAVKTFARGGTRLETRVILRIATRFEAATYRWRTDLSDGDRVDAPVTEDVGGGPWQFPDPDGCRTCHTTESGFLLGVRAAQLPRRTVVRWIRDGDVSDAPAYAASVERLVPLRASGPTNRRVRSYLDANCASCHRPDADVNAGLDLRASTPLEATGMLDLLPQHGDLGIADPRILAPGDPSRSVLVARMETLEDTRMPAVGSRAPDRAALRLLRRWIRRM